MKKLLENPQMGHISRPELMDKDGRRSAKEDGAPKGLRCRTVKREIRKILQKVLACAAGSIFLLFYLG